MVTMIWGLVLTDSGGLLGHFGSILGRPGALLGPSWVVLGLSLAVLGPFGCHLGAILDSSWDVLGASWGVLGPSWAAWVVWAVLDNVGPFWGDFWAMLGSILGSKTYIFLVFWGGYFLDYFLTIVGPLLDSFWGAFWEQIGPRRGQDGFKGAIKSFKEPKSCICKNHKKLKVFLVFRVQRPPKTALGCPRRFPRSVQKRSKTLKNVSNN